MIVTLDELHKVRENTDKKIVLATGTFDLFHYEHVMYLEEAKKKGDILVVAVKSNSGARLKGPHRPIIDETHRISIVDAIRFVDYSVIANYDDSVRPSLAYDNETQRQWLIMFESVFEALRPDILYHESNVPLQSARERAFKVYGIQGIPKKRGESISTSSIVEKLSHLSAS